MKFLKLTMKYCIIILFHHAMQIYPELAWVITIFFGHPGAILGHPVFIFGHPGDLGSSQVIQSHHGSSLGHLGSTWGHCLVILGQPGAILEPSLVILAWFIMESLWVFLGSSLGYAGVILVQRGFLPGSSLGSGRRLRPKA